jgi:hypothetical protein
LKNVMGVNMKPISYANEKFPFSAIIFLSIVLTACAAQNQDTEVAPSTPVISCPTNYVRVPALAPYTTQDFCVAQFEAKQGAGNVAVSQAAGAPWDVDRPTALTACQGNGSGYDLISNAQWQTIARNMEQVASNWTSGIVGVGIIYVGHSDNSPGNTIEVTSTSDPYSDTGDNAGEAVGSGKEQRRMLALSNGETIWDLSGNAFEFVKDANDLVNISVNLYVTAVNDTVRPQVDTFGGITGTAKTLFGPAGDYSGLNSAPDYGGLGHTAVSSGDALHMRGRWFAGPVAEAGIFNILGNSINATAGIRCVFH